MSARRYRLAACAFALSVTPGCQPREANSDLRNFLQPSPTPTVVIPESPRSTFVRHEYRIWRRDPLANVLVETLGRTTLTNESGFYEFQRLGRTDISFSKEGFGAPGPFHVVMNRPRAIDASLQRLIETPASQVLTATLFRNDPFLNVSGEIWADLDGWVCGPPCKVVRVAVPLSGPLRASVTWQPFGRDFDLMLAQGVGSARPSLAGGAGSIR